MAAKSRPITMAMLCAAAVTAQFVSGKATRDALFLTSMDFTALPTMLMATSVCSILLVAAHTRGARTLRPAVLVPASFVASGVLFLCEWILRAHAPSAIAVTVYLHVSGAGPLLASGFWLIASERFDPRTAKKRFGQIAGAGTLGGLVSALVAERMAAFIGVPAMLPFLAALQFLSAWLVRRLAVEGESAAYHAPADVTGSAVPSRSGLRVVAETPYLRHLATLVLLGTTGAALVDYLFKAEAVATFGRGDQLLRFFALYYAGTSLVAFVLQTTSSRIALERVGLGFTTSTPSFALCAGSIGSLFAPGLGTLMCARAGEAVFRGSLFRAGYELFYTPIPADEKRAVKSIIDVAFDRLGDAIGGGLVRLAVLLVPVSPTSAILFIGIGCSAGAVLAASRLNRGYVHTLENSLVHLGADLSDPGPGLMRTLMRTAFERPALEHGPVAAPAIESRRARQKDNREPAASGAASLDPDVRDILTLRSRNRDRIVEVLSREVGMQAALVPHAIRLLAWDAVAEQAVFALRKVAEGRIGQLADALIDPGQDFAIRRRVARVFSVCVSQRAADALIGGLDDLRFDVRYQSARSLTAIVARNPLVRMDAERIFAVVRQEVTVGKPVWESRRLLDAVDAGESESPLDAFVRDRAGASLAHVFTLLSLVLPSEPLQIAFRSLYSDDEHLQGTALEYLEGVLPPSIRQRLWPFLERGPITRPERPRDEIIEDLLRSNHTVILNLEALRQRIAPAMEAAL